jgi:hypothetical protein
MNNGFLSNMIYFIPYLLIDVAGLTYAIVHWRRHPRLSLLITIALALSVMRILFVNIVLPAFVSVSGGPNEPFINIVLTVLSTFSSSLLIVTAFFGFQEGLRAKKE